MRYHYVRESIELGEIKFFNVYTDDNLADPFMKALSKEKLTQHARSIGLRLASSFMMCPPNSHDIYEMNIGLPQWKRISDKRMKNQAKNDKTEHGMEKHGKDKAKDQKVQSKSKSQPRQKSKSRPKP
ncbi:hypothetical protein Tco_0653555 [Tanacetum coccineum]|uniref:Uncharacterized protein n=1 Tax=Tanacetum coccineum TaxID=301880 RepID=A0ABQ4X1I0_9ASTR